MIQAKSASIFYFPVLGGHRNPCAFARALLCQPPAPTEKQCCISLSTDATPPIYHLNLCSWRGSVENDDSRFHSLRAYAIANSLSCRPLALAVTSSLNNSKNDNSRLTRCRASRIAKCRFYQSHERTGHSPPWPRFAINSRLTRCRTPRIAKRR